MISRRIGSLRYPYHSQILLSGTIHAQKRTVEVCHKTPYIAKYSCNPPPDPQQHKCYDRQFSQDFRSESGDRTGTPISKHTGLPTHPLTAIPADATPQRFY